MPSVDGSMAFGAPAEPVRTLEDDAALLEQLRTLAASMTARTKAVNDSLGSLAKEAREAEVGAKNAFNGFLMLCNTQFVETRVYEEAPGAAGAAAPGGE